MREDATVIDPKSRYDEPLYMPTSIDIVAFRVAEEPNRVPVDVRCLCGRHLSFRRIFVNQANHTRWQDGSQEGVCPDCGRPLRVEVTVTAKATVIGRPEPATSAPAPTGQEGV